MNEERELKQTKRIVLDASSVDMEEVSRAVENGPSRLRFINRNGKRILQQLFVYHSFNASGAYIGGGEEWKDIPYIPNAEQGDMTEHP